MKKEINVWEEILKRLVLMILIWVLCRMLLKIDNADDVVCSIFFIAIFTLVIMYLREKNMYEFEKNMHMFWRKNYEDYFDNTQQVLTELEEDLENELKKDEDEREEQ